MAAVLFAAVCVKVEDVRIILLESNEIVVYIVVLRIIEVLFYVFVDLVAVDAVCHQLRDTVRHAVVFIYHAVIETHMHDDNHHQHQYERAGDEQKRQLYR